LLGEVEVVEAEILPLVAVAVLVGF